jgi:hypothetical protein
MLPLHEESKAQVPAPVDAVFAYLDDHTRLSKHMTKSSWLMAGSSMSVQVDAAEGKAVGSKITMSGRILGVTLGVEEVVIERRPPVCKVWQTIGAPRLIVIESYRMGFAIDADGDASSLTVFIDYRVPSDGFGRAIRFVGRVYARWCTAQMVRDTVAHFQRRVQE